MATKKNGCGTKSGKSACGSKAAAMKPSDEKACGAMPAEAPKAAKAKKAGCRSKC